MRLPAYVTGFASAPAPADNSRLERRARAVDGARALAGASPGAVAAQPLAWIEDARPVLLELVTAAEEPRGIRRATDLRAERDELLRLGRDLIQTVPMTEEYLLCLRAFAQAVYRERR